MGKIRVKTLGDESAEREQEEKARKRAEAKKAKEAESRAAKVESAEVEQGPEDPEAEGRRNPSSAEGETKTEAASAESSGEPKEEVKKPKKNKYADKKKKKAARSQKYQTLVAKVDKSKTYSLKDALNLLPDLHIAKFDETVELHINTIEQGVSGSLTLPHGTGKKMRVVIADQTNDPKAVEELVKAVEGGKIEFDILVATPDAMPKLARVAKFLGPRGLMPNPKNGTVTPKPDVVAKKFEGGQINFKTETKAPIIHIAVGKMSFGNEKLSENIQTVLSSVDSKKIVNVTLKSTMSPGIRLSL